MSIPETVIVLLYGRRVERVVESGVERLTIDHLRRVSLSCIDVSLE